MPGQSLEWRPCVAMVWLPGPGSNELPAPRARTQGLCPKNSLTLSRTCSMILLASPSKALTLSKLAGTDIPRQGQKSFHNTRGVPMTKTRRSFFTLASSSVLVLALGAGPVFADSCGSNSGGGLHHGGGSSVGGAIGGVVHHLQFIFGVYHKGHSPI